MEPLKSAWTSCCQKLYICALRGVDKWLVILLYKPGAQISGDQRDKFHEDMARFEERNFSVRKVLVTALRGSLSFLFEIGHLCSWLKAVYGAKRLVVESGHQLYMCYNACVKDMCQRHVLDFVFTTKTPFNACPWSLHVVRIMYL